MTTGLSCTRDSIIVLGVHFYKNTKMKFPSPVEMKKYEDAQQCVKKFSDKYEVIVPFQQGVSEEIEAMQNIKAAIIANSIADKQCL